MRVGSDSAISQIAKKQHNRLNLTQIVNLCEQAMGEIVILCTQATALSNGDKTGAWYDVTAYLFGLFGVYGRASLMWAARQSAGTFCGMRLDRVLPTSLQG